MKKFATILSAAALASSFATAPMAQETKVSDPFVTSQGETGVLGLSTVGVFVVTTVVIATVIGIADSSSSSTTTN